MHQDFGLNERYCDPMPGEQRVIVGWMQAQLDRLQISATTWARRAGLAPTTLTRGMAEDFPSVTSTPKLVALAEAAGVPTVLDFLTAQSVGASVPQPTRDVLTRILEGLECSCAGASSGSIADAMMLAIGRVSRADTGLQGSAAFLDAVAAEAIISARSVPHS